MRRENNYSTVTKIKRAVNKEQTEMKNISNRLFKIREKKRKERRGVSKKRKHICRAYFMHQKTSR